jgi:hypothetical protein
MLSSQIKRAIVALSGFGCNCEYMLKGEAHDIHKKLMSWLSSLIQLKTKYVLKYSRATFASNSLTLHPTPHLHIRGPPILDEVDGKQLGVGLWNTAVCHVKFEKRGHDYNNFHTTVLLLYGACPALH